MKSVGELSLASTVVVSLPGVSSSSFEEMLSLFKLCWKSKTIVVGKEVQDVLSELGIEFENNIITQLNKPIDKGASDVECPYCDTLFDTSSSSRNDITVHVGSCHFEEELLNEKSKLFPLHAKKCIACGETLFKTDEKKEHILKVHPWDSLTLAVSKIHKDLVGVTIYARQVLSKNLLQC